MAEVKVPLMVQNARNAKRAQGSCLEYGLKNHLSNFVGAVRILSFFCIFIFN